MKKSTRISLVSAALSLIVFMLSVSFQAQPVKVAGTWNMTVDTPQGAGTPVFVLKQENDTLLTGTYVGRLGESPVKGTIKANKVSLKFYAAEMDIEYIGIVEGNTMKGKIVFGTVGEGTFTGKRKED
jgi:hypothetical protein